MSNTQHDLRFLKNGLLHPCFLEPGLEENGSDRCIQVIIVLSDWWRYAAKHWMISESAV